MNLGLVITANGALLIDSGPTLASAQKIHDAVRRVTDQPIRWVIIRVDKIIVGWVMGTCNNRARS